MVTCDITEVVSAGIGIYGAVSFSLLVRFIFESHYIMPEEITMCDFASLLQY